MIRTGLHARALLVVLALAGFSMCIDAAPLRFVPQTLRQPDGSILHCYASGDEYYNWLHDAGGYTIMQSPSTGWYVYAVLSNGRLVPSEAVPGRTDPARAGITPWLRMPPGQIAAQNGFAKRGGGAPAPATPTIGTINNVVIYIRFSDEPEYTDSLSMYDRMFNMPASNSMYAYFDEASYGQLAIRTSFFPVSTNGTVLSFQDSHPRSYFMPYNATSNPDGYQADRTAREHQLLADAVTAVAAQIPDTLAIDADKDGNVDNVCFIIDGAPTAWSTLLWPHMWSLDSRTVKINGARVLTYNFQLQQPLAGSGSSVLCHEMFHSLGSPDLYHYSSNGLSPVGSWDLMEQNLSPPQHMTAYMKWKYGHWIPSIPEIRAPGTYTLKPLLSKTDNCFRIPSPYSTSEYFVVEYRKKTGIFESSLPGEGLLVYRINPNYRGNASGPPDEVYVYRPDGTTKANGSTGLACFSSTAKRTAINDGTNPSSFLTSGAKGGLNISNVTAAGATISFDVVLDTQSVQILAPLKNSQWIAGTKHRVSWLAYGSTRRIDVEYSLDAGATWTMLASAAAAPFYWTVPDTPSRTCRLRIVDVAARHVRDSVDFAICRPFYRVGFNYDATDTTKAKDNLGVIFIGEEFWTSRAGSDYLYRWSKTGEFTAPFTIAGAAAIKALTWDGTDLFAATGSNRIPRIDPLTRNRLELITMPVKASYCTYDPTADGGRGGLWIGDGGSDIVLASRSGAELARIPAATHGIDDITGLAWDGVTPGGPYLWAFCRGGSGEPQYIQQLRLPDGRPTDVFHDVLQDIGSTTTNGLAGGLYLGTNVIPGHVVLCGTLQGTPNRLFGYVLPGGSSTVLLDEPFAYPPEEPLTDHNWAVENGMSVNPVMVREDGLQYPRYAGSNVGRSAAMHCGMTARQDVARPMQERAAGDVYAAMLVSVSAASLRGSRILSLEPGAGGVPAVHLFVRGEQDGRIRYGISRPGTDAHVVYADSLCEKDSTQLIVLRYHFRQGAEREDEASLWVDPPVRCFEPEPAARNADSVDGVRIGSFLLSQFDTEPCDAAIDGIRVATTWADAMQLRDEKLSQSILIVDATDEHAEPFLGMGVTDSTVDAFYYDIFHPSATWDLLAQGTPKLDLLQQYQLVVWHGDHPNVAPHAIARQDIQDLLGQYVEAGGKLLISGWRAVPSFDWGKAPPHAFAPGTFAHDFLGIASCDETADSGDCSSLPGMSGFASLTVDPAKLPSLPYLGLLDRVGLITGVKDSTLPMTSYMNPASTPHPEYRGQVTSICNRTETSMTFTLGFPLYFTERESARRFVHDILRFMGVTAFLTDVEPPAAAAHPGGFSLDQNYPNPFNPGTTVSFAVPLRSDVRIDVFDALGRLVDTPASGTFEAGRHVFQWTPRLPSGIYFCRMVARSDSRKDAPFVGVRRMILAK